jgi:ABC-type Mn2+/Zn2+ transport system permease subunit
VSELLVPFEYGYMVRAMWVGGAVGGVCGVLSCFVVLKGWSLMGDALSHAVVPGVVLAWLAGLPFAIGAFISGMAAAWVMGAISARSRIRPDAVIGIVFTTFFGLGLVLITAFPSNIQLRTIIFGNILGVADEDIVQMALIAALVLGVIAIRGRDLLLACFDPAHARTIGLDPARLEFILLSLLAAMAVAGLQTVGAVLVIAMLVTPGATAFLLTDRFWRMAGIAGAIGFVTSVAGAYASWFLDGSTGGTVVVLQTVIFLLVLAFAPRHGMLAARLLRRRAAAFLPAPALSGVPRAGSPHS